MGFGTSAARAAPGAHDPWDIARAWAQHLAAVAVVEEIQARGIEVEQAARSLDTKGRTLRQKLVGLDSITLDDLVAWTIVIGDRPVRAWASIAGRPFPTNYWVAPAAWVQGQWLRPASGVVLDGHAWDALAAVLQQHVATERRHARGHLLDDAQVAAAARAALMEHGMPAVELQLRPAPGRNVFDVDGTASLAVLFGRDPNGAEALSDLRRRTAESLSVLAESDQGATLLIAILEPAAEQLLSSMLDTPTVDSHSNIPWFRVAEHLAASAAPSIDFSIHWETREQAQTMSASVWRIEKAGQAFAS